MATWSWKAWIGLAGGLALTPVLMLSAAEPNVGIVRISDSSHRGVHGASYSKGGKSHASGGTWTGGSVDGSCPHCWGDGCLPAGCKQGCLSGKFCEHYCTNSPDYGFSIPGKYPIHRRGVQFAHYFPPTWYGSGVDHPGPSYPTVYQPTDTTQLGYYYQHVPFWMPQPNPLPQRPLPARWHNYAPAVAASAFHQGWNWHYGPGLVADFPVINTVIPPANNGSPTLRNDALQSVPNEPPPAPVGPDR
uniref:Uncharacterized protein n=1 Tax=Schlesneria paludicola TaxID=360056 RepID=A0A7C4LN94_9PLAN